MHDERFNADTTNRLDDGNVSDPVGAGVRTQPLINPQVTIPFLFRQDEPRDITHRSKPWVTTPDIHADIHTS